MEEEAMRLWEAGAEELEGKLQQHPNQPRVRAFLSSFYARLGKRAAFEREVSLATNGDLTRTIPHNLVDDLIKLGEHERGLGLLIRAEEEGFYFGELLPAHVDALRNLPGYPEFMQKVAEKHRRFLALY